MSIQKDQLVITAGSQQALYILTQMETLVENGNLDREPYLFTNDRAHSTSRNPLSNN